jgi:hypothetical protein
MKRLLSLAFAISIVAIAPARADSVVLPEPLKLSEGELGTVRGGAPSPMQRGMTEAQSVEGAGQSAAPNAATIGASAGVIVNSGIGGPLGGNGGLQTILSGQVTSGRLSFSQ